MDASVYLDNVNSLFADADKCLLLRDYKQAEVRINSILELLADSDHKNAVNPTTRNRMFAQAYRCLGGVENQRGNQSLSLEHLNKSLQIYEDVDDVVGTASVLGTIGNMYASLSDHEKGLEYSTRALTLYESTDDKYNTANLLGNIGLAHFARADYRNALEHYERSREISEEQGDKDSVARELDRIGNVYRELADFPTALEYLKSALDINRESGNKNFIARNLHNIGVVYCLMRDYDRALDYLTQARTIIETFDSRYLMAAIVTDIGVVYSNSDRLDESLELFNKALQFNIEIGNKSGVARSLSNMGYVLLDQSNYDSALEKISKALGLGKEVDDKVGIASRLYQLGRIYASPDYIKFDPKEAEKLMRQALNIFDSLGAKSRVVTVLNELSGLYNKLARWKDSLECLKKMHVAEQEVLGEQTKNRIEGFNIRLAVAEKAKEASEHRSRTESLELEMKWQKQELSNQVLQYIQQADVLEKLRSDLEGIVQKADTADIAIRKVRKSLKALPDNMLNWRRFYDDLRSVYPEFERNLTQAYPQLTSMEVKVCCLLLIGMSTREISTLLFISEKTVDIHRGHIRKKLAIPRTQDMQTVLQQWT